MEKLAADRPVESLSRDELLDLVRRQQRIIERLERRIAELEAEVERLRREGHQHAPFCRGCAASRKKPGRKKGKGLFANRPAPDPADVTHREEAPPPPHCPCGGELEFMGFEDASTTDAPEKPRPRVTAFRVAVCRCKDCGRTVRGTHPDLAKDQHGATAHRVGPRVMAAAHVMHYGFGVPVHKVVPVLKELTGVTVTQSAITQDALRRPERGLKGQYQALRESIPDSPVVNTDDTGWRVGGKPAQLMVFATPTTATDPGKTVYQIRRQHRNEEVREVVPADYAGTMTTDRGRSYDAKEFDEVKQQKCISHVQRSIGEVLEKKSGAARDFGEELKALLKRTIRWWHKHHAGKRGGSVAIAKALDAEVAYVLRPRRFTDPDNQRLLDELGWHYDRGNLTRFLGDPRVAPTNNLSERELRGAVVARKVSHCSKNDRGARAHECHTSIIRTEQRKKPASLVDAYLRRIRATEAVAEKPP